MDGDNPRRPRRFCGPIRFGAGASGENGGVEIRGWEGSGIEAHAHVETWAATEDEARQLAGAIRVVTSGTTISVYGPEPRGRSHWGASLALYVPRRSDLKLETHNGPIGVRNVTGQMTLETYNGPVGIDGVGGDVRLRTTNGPLNVTLAGAHWDGAGLDAATTNGPVRLAIPENYSARLEFGTVNGPMTVGFPIEVMVQGRVGRRMTTTLGSGGAAVRVVTTNGPVEVK